MAERDTIEVPSPGGGWGAPWPNVAEVEAVLTHEKWSLVGGLMAQLHAIHRGVSAIRPTNDVDIVLHVETTRGVAAEAAYALESIGYVFAPSIDARNTIAHRFVRGTSRVDLVATATDVVDVLVADHAAPRVIEKLRGKDMKFICRSGREHEMCRRTGRGLPTHPPIHSRDEYVCGCAGRGPCGSMHP